MMRAILTAAALIAMTYAAQAQPSTCNDMGSMIMCSDGTTVYRYPTPSYTPAPPPIVVPHPFTQELASGAYALESTERTRQMQAANPPPCPIGLRWLGICE